DPGLTRHGWIADRLLERIPNEGYPAARGGFLDAETVWPILLRQELGLSAEPPDLTPLLRWSIDTAATGRFRVLPEACRKGVTEWLVEKIGQVAAVILRCVSELALPDAVPLGLAASVVFHPETTGKLERAAGKLEERYLGGRTEEVSLLQRWSSAATEVVRALRHTDSRPTDRSFRGRMRSFERFRQTPTPTSATSHCSVLISGWPASANDWARCWRVSRGTNWMSLKPPEMRSGITISRHGRFGKSNEWKWLIDWSDGLENANELAMSSHNHSPRLPPSISATGVSWIGQGSA